MDFISNLTLAFSCIWCDKNQISFLVHKYLYSTTLKYDVVAITPYQENENPVVELRGQNK